MTLSEAQAALERAEAARFAALCADDFAALNGTMKWHDENVAACRRRAAAIEKEKT